MLQKLCNNLLEATVVGRLLRRLLITDHIYGRYIPNPDNESHSRKSPSFSKRGLRSLQSNTQVIMIEGPLVFLLVSNSIKRKHRPYGHGLRLFVFVINATISHESGTFTDSRTLHTQYSTIIWRWNCIHTPGNIDIFWRKKGYTACVQNAVIVRYS